MSAPEALLRSLGITNAAQIDLEVIAWHCGLRVHESVLHGADARIVGAGGRGVLTVHREHRPERQRFSIAHELGHWHLHRGQLMVCRAEDILGGASQAKGRENDADAFAAALLMPSYLFLPAAAALAGKQPWTQAATLAEQFRTSLVATALRMITLDVWPGWLVLSEVASKGWAFRAPSAAASSRPAAAVDARSGAFEMVFGRVALTRSKQLPGDVWFYGRDRELLVEHCRPYGAGKALSFIRLL